MLRHLLPDLLCSGWSEDEQSRLRAEPRFGESPEEATKGYEKVYEEAEEGAEQDVQEQPEEYPLSEEAVLRFDQAIQPPPTTTSPS